MRRSILIGFIIVLVGSIQGCSQRPPETGARPKIATTIFPLYDIARNIVGDRLEVIEILPPGASPHTYEVSPRQVKQLGGAKVVFCIGHGLDDWTGTLLDTIPGLKKVVVDAGAHLIESAETNDRGHPGEASEGGHLHREGVNPHYWLSIENGRRIARNIAEEVIKLDAAGEGLYNANLDAYISELDRAEEQIKGRISGLSRKKIMTFHAAWSYFAEGFGLEIVGAFEPSPGKQPTPRSLAGLHEKAREHGVTALFSEPQLSNEAVAAFVEDLGLRLYVLDPLGGVEGRGSYIELLEYNADVIVEALSDE